MTDVRTRVLFVNSGILGHRAVAELLKLAAGRVAAIDAAHVSLTQDLTVADRIVRRVMCAHVMPKRGALANLDLARWRQEVHAGLFAARRLAAAERQHPADVLHFHTQATAYASIRRMKRTPAIVSIDTTHRLASLELSSPLARATYRPNVVHDGFVFGAARAIVATSRWAARDLADLYPDCAAKVRVLPYPVREDQFDPEWLPARAIRSRNGSRQPVRILFMGGDFPRKGGPQLLDAWRQLSIDGRAELELVTDWPIDPRALPAGARVLRGVAPYSAEWRDAWRRADVFAMPTCGEAFGMVFQESAAAGVPAIATNINAIPELVDDGCTGLLVKPGDTDALGRALSTLIESADLRQRMGAAARTRMLALASLDTYARSLSDVIDAVKNTHASRA